MANAAAVQCPSGLGKIAFLNNLGRDVFFLSQIGDRINVRTQSDGSVSVTIRSGVQLSYDWVMTLRLVLWVNNRFELREVVGLGFARSGRVLTLTTRMRRVLRPSEVFGDQHSPGAILFLAETSARLIQAQAIS